MRNPCVEFQGHLTTVVRSVIQGVVNGVGVILGRMSSQLQILDIIVNKPFINHLKQLYFEGTWLGTVFRHQLGQERSPV